MSLTTTLVILGLVIIAALGVYAGKLLYLLRQQNQRQANARNKRIDKITESIFVIVKAMQQQQCDLSEGTIRICNLLAALPIENQPNYKSLFPQIHTLYIEISGFAILEAREKLSKVEKRKQDRAREEIESEYESLVLPELDKIASYCHELLAERKKSSH